MAELGCQVCHLKFSGTYLESVRCFKTRYVVSTLRFFVQVRAFDPTVDNIEYPLLKAKLKTKVTFLKWALSAETKNNMTIGNTHGIEGFTLDDAMKRLVEMYGLFTNDMLVSIKTIFLL